MIVTIKVMWAKRNLQKIRNQNHIKNKNTITLRRALKHSLQERRKNPKEHAASLAKLDLFLKKEDARLQEQILLEEKKKEQQI